MPPEVIVAGHIALDILPDMASLTPEQVIAPGKVYEIGRISYSTGGAVSNTGLALHQLGVNVGLQAVVGDDWIGRAIIDYVRGFGPRLADHIRTVPRQRPGLAFLELGRHAWLQQAVGSRRSAAEMLIRDGHESIARPCQDLLHQSR